jgi:RNA polymerase sigma-70 factor, ECF subfamily
VDDESLVSRISQGDQAAFSILYDRYVRILYSFSMKSLNSREESEEVVLDVFSQVWRIADRYVASKGRVDTWLFMVTRSRILDRLRKRRRSVPSENVFLQLTEIQSEQFSLVIELSYYQGLSQSEIAQQTGLSLGTIKTRVRLGLNKLKSTLS